MRILFGIIVATIFVGFTASIACARDTYESLDTNQCFSYGARLGSDIYVKCRLSLAEMHQQEQLADETSAVQEQAANDARRRAILGVLNSNCTTTYIGMQAHIHCN